MKIFVKAKAGAKEEKVEAPAAKLWEENKTTEKKGMPEEDSWYKISVKEPPLQGRANEAIIKVLAEYFKVSRSQVRLVSGFSSKRKVFEIS